MYAKKQHKTAILVFANSSLEEVKHKPIAKGCSLFDALTVQTLKTVSKSQLPSFHYSEKYQIGDSFGERFTNAIQAVFDKGFENIITIGNDSPQLQVSHILEAANQLQNKKFVLGPSTDGGFYLMGLHKSQFDSSEFKKLAWQTAILSKQLLGLVSLTAADIFRLPTLFDIDTVKDMKSIISYTYRLPKKILVVLISTLQIKKASYKGISFFIPFTATRTLHNKGSPALLRYC